MSSMEELKKKHEKEYQELLKRQKAEVADLADKLSLAHTFHQVLINDQHLLKRLMTRGKLCVLCRCNYTPANYAKRIVLNAGDIYCDIHGKLQTEHRPRHPDAVENCEDCALLDCPFLCDSHDITDRTNCHECRQYC